MAIVSSYISIITLNVNELNSSIKWLAGLENNTQLYAIFWRLVSALKAHIGSKWRGVMWYSKQVTKRKEKKSKESRCSHTCYRNIKFKPKMVTKGNKSYYIMIKGSIHQEVTTIINIYTPNNWALNYIMQILTDPKEK